MVVCDLPNNSNTVAAAIHSIHGIMRNVCIYCIERYKHNVVWLVGRVLFHYLALKSELTFDRIMANMAWSI